MKSSLRLTVHPEEFVTLIVLVQYPYQGGYRKKQSPIHRPKSDILRSLIKFFPGRYDIKEHQECQGCQEFHP